MFCLASIASSSMKPLTFDKDRAESPSRDGGACDMSGSMECRTRHRNRGLRAIWLGLPSLGNRLARSNEVYNHNTYVSHSQAFVSPNVIYGTHTSFDHSGGFNSGAWHGSVGLRYGAYNGFNSGGVARTFAFHAAPAFGGGFHVGGIPWRWRFPRWRRPQVRQDASAAMSSTS